MATLDISGALQAMVAGNTPQAMMERNLATAMFSDRVTTVVDDALKKLEDTTIRVRALEQDGKLTPEQAQMIIDAREDQVTHARRFAASYFAG